MAFRTLKTARELSYYCSQFRIIVLTHPMGTEFDFIVIAPLLASHCSFCIVLRRGVPFFGEFQCPFVNGCSIASCDFGALAGGDEYTSFYSAILN